MSIAAKDQIQGWKEIAAYLGRDERTAKRWEKQRGLPVRRIPGSGRANVYILVADLEAWLSEGTSPRFTADFPAHDELSNGFELPSDAVEESNLLRRNGDADPAATFNISNSDSRQHPSFALIESPAFTAAKSNRPSRWALLLLLVATAGVGAVVLALRPRPHSAAVTSSPPVRSVYKSPIPGLDELYLQGEFFLEERTPASLEAARTDFINITARDQSYAPAYAGLSATYLLLREYASMSDNEAYERGRVAAERALSLDPNLPEAHASLGFIDFFSDWKAITAAQHFKTAIQLDPNCVLAHHWFGSMLTHQARYPEAIAELNAAQRIQPASTAVLASRAFALGLSGQRSEATELLKSVIRTDPQEAPPHRILASLSLIQPRDMPQFFDQLRLFAAIRKDSYTAAFVVRASNAYRRGGEQAFWLLLSSEQSHLDPARDDGVYPRVQADAQLGLFDDAFHVLNLLVDRHDRSVIGILIDHSLDPLHKDPRFQQLVQRIPAFQPS